jgi:hypothetical protein
VDRSTGKQAIAPSGRFAGSDLADRLHKVRKRRRAFCGRTLDVQVLRRRLREEQRREHDS